MPRSSRRAVSVVVGAVALVGLMAPQASADEAASPVKRVITKLGFPTGNVDNLVIDAAGAASDLV
ncbi:hypothetical protein ACH4VR_12645 [Streptomyces sp. NPDC020883]|uniref:hypothetical protein n=1 Tax=Streptomyces sp. NPDC020883 TaxID=3365099 RepID=UPI0037AADE49